jgi:hypothetical protein
MFFRLMMLFMLIINEIRLNISPLLKTTSSFIDSILSLRWSLVWQYSMDFYKYYRGSAAKQKLQSSDYICSKQINETGYKLQRSDNILIELK